MRLTPLLPRDSVVRKGEFNAPMMNVDDPRLRVAPLREQARGMIEQLLLALLTLAGQAPVAVVRHRTNRIIS